MTTSAQQAVQPQQTANPYQADPQTAYAVPEMEPEQTPIDYGQFATSTNYPHTYDVEDSSDVDMDALSGFASDVFDKQPRKKLSRKERKAQAKEMKKLQKESNAKLKANAKSNKSIHDALNADVSERFNIQYEFQCDQMIDAMQFDMTLILTEKVDSMDGYRLIQSVCDWREENLEVIEDAENNLDYGKVPSYVAYERPADIGTTIIDELCASQGTAVEKLVNYPTTKFERTMRDELFEALAVNETTISLMAKVPSSVFLDAVACMDSRYMSGHTVDTGHAFIVSPGTYEPYIGIHDPVYGAGYMMVDLDKPFEIPMNRIWIAMDDYSGPETKEGLRGMYHSPQDVSAFSDPFCGSVSVTPTRDEKQEPAKSGLEAKRDACAISAAHLDSPNTEIPDGKNMERE